MTTTFASSLGGMGASVVRGMANATMSIGGAVSVDGIYRNPSSLAVVGTMGGMQARQPRFDCVTADLCCTDLDRGTSVSIGQQVFKVRLRTDRTEAGVSELELEAAE